MAFPSDLVPPGTHLTAALSWEDDAGSHHTRLRILGDDRRGYVLMGAPVSAESDEIEFWFATLDEAKRAAADFGVRDTWGEVTSTSQVGLRTRDGQALEIDSREPPT